MFQNLHFKSVYKQGFEQFIPFVATIIGILFTDLLKGISIGMVFAIFYILRNNYKNAFNSIKDIENENHDHLIVLSEELSFLNKGRLLNLLNDIPKGSKVVIDGTNTKSMHYDVVEIIENFQVHAKTIGIELEIKGIKIN